MPPGDDDHRHAQGGDADDRGLARDQLEVAGRKNCGPTRRPKIDRHQDAGPRNGARPLEQRSRAFTSPRRPMAVMISACSSSSPAGRAGPRRAAAHHGDAVAQPEQLGQVAADHQHGLARGRPEHRPTPGCRSARRSAPCCRRRCRGSARRAAARPRRGGAGARARPSAGCRPTAAPTGCRAPGAADAQRVDPALGRPRPAGPASTRPPGPRPAEPGQRQVVGDAQRPGPAPRPCGPR